MRKQILAVALIACALVSPAGGQGSSTASPRPLFAIHSWIDIPNVFVATDYDAHGFNISGWAFDCRTGQQPPYVAVLDHDMTTTKTQWLSSFLVFRELPRPDVAEQFNGTCPNVATNTGYAVYPNTELGPGLHFLTVFWNTGDGLARSQGVAVNVAPPQ